MCSSTCIQNDVLKDVTLIIPYPFWKSSLDRRYRLREQPINWCLPASPVRLDHRIVESGGLEEAISKNGVPRQEQLGVIRSLHQVFFHLGLFWSFKQWTWSHSCCTWLYKAHGNLGSLSAHYVQTKATKHTCSHSRSEASKKEREGKNGEKTAAACWQYLAVVLPHLWNYFSSSDLTILVYL